MARKHRKHKKHSHMDESWLLPYADLMTLLLSLFIALFAMSTLDAQKFEKMSTIMNQILTGGEGVMDFESPIETPIQKPEETKDDENEVAKEKNELEILKQKLDKYIKDNNLGGMLETTLTGEGLMLTITSEILFESGSANPSGKSRNLAAQIGKMLQGKTKRSIMVSGHTDDRPINSGRFKSNWDLSVARAVNFMDLMVETSKLTEDQFSVKGYGEFKPIATNGTSTGRAKNRRVEVLVIPNFLEE